MAQSSYLYELKRRVLETFEVEIISDSRPSKAAIKAAVAEACDPHAVECLSERVRLKKVAPLDKQEAPDAR